MKDPRFARLFEQILQQQGGGRCVEDAAGGFAKGERNGSGSGHLQIISLSFWDAG